MLQQTLIALLASAGLISAAVPPAYVGARDYRTGGFNLNFVIADINKDGIPDAIASGGEGTVLLLGRPGGKFAPPTLIYQLSATSTAVADFNNDGNADLVLSAISNGSILVILLGNGDGTFQPPSVLPKICIDCYLASADFNGDGNMDLAVANTNSFNAYLGNGDGTFRNAQTYGTEFVIYAAAGDLNGDGSPDVVLVDASSLDVFFSRGDGTFGEVVYRSAPGGFQAQIADLNGDGMADIVTQSREESTVIVRLNQGRGIFGPETKYPAGCPAGACSFESVWLGDVNGDGRLDAVTPGSYLLGAGDGTFGPPVTFSAGNGPLQAVAADLDGDGLADIVVAAYTSIDLRVLLSAPHGPLQAPAFPAGATPEDAAAADFNGDGKLDLAVADYGFLGPGGVHVFLNTGYGGMKRELTLAVENPGAILTADFNGDGLADLAVSSQSTGTTIFLGLGNGQFRQGATYGDLYGDCTNHAIGQVPSVCFAVADVNGDGILDLAGANWIDGQITVMLGNGDGTFRLGQTFTGSASQTGLAVADINGDGKPDLIFSGNFFGVAFYFGKGDGTFGAEHLLKSQLSPAGVTVGDLTSDGIPDIVIAGGQGASAYSLADSYFAGHGDGTFNPEVFIPADLAPNAVALADVNGDGKLDVISANYAADNVSVSLNKGGGRFGTPLLYEGGGLPCQLVTADILGNGKPNLFVVDQGGTITELIAVPR